VVRLAPALALAVLVASAALPAAAAPPAESSSRSQAVALAFDNADIETVVQAVSEIAGFNYILAPDVRGKVTMRASAIRREDVLPLLQSVLEMNGFTAVKAGDLYKIVRIETARERPIPTFIDIPSRVGGPDR